MTVRRTLLAALGGSADADLLGMEGLALAAARVVAIVDYPSDDEIVLGEGLESCGEAKCDGTASEAL
jgi:hypothetical protein